MRPPPLHGSIGAHATDRPNLILGFHGRGCEWIATFPQRCSGKAPQRCFGRIRYGQGQLLWGDALCRRDYAWFGTIGQNFPLFKLYLLAARLHCHDCALAILDSLLAGEVGTLITEEQAHWWGRESNTLQEHAGFACLGV